MLHELYLGFIKVHILHHAAQDAVYGLWLIEELGHHGYKLSPGTLYPTLHNMEEKGLLTSEKRVVGGRQRRYYQITPKGLATLDEARSYLKELVDEVFEP